MLIMIQPAQMIMPFDQDPVSPLNRQNRHFEVFSNAAHALIIKLSNCLRGSCFVHSGASTSTRVASFAGWQCCHLFFGGGLTMHVFLLFPFLLLSNRAQGSMKCGVPA
jgi:hypothetical protein